jgi:hypothetical protein
MTPRFLMLETLLPLPAAPAKPGSSPALPPGCRETVEGKTFAGMWSDELDGVQQRQPRILVRMAATFTLRAAMTGCCSR